MKDLIRKQAQRLWLEQFYRFNFKTFADLSKLIDPEDPDGWIEFVAQRYANKEDLSFFERQAGKSFRAH